jgi:hypothetical protein
MRTHTLEEMQILSWCLPHHSTHTVQSEIIFLCISCVRPLGGGCAPTHVMNKENTSRNPCDESSSLCLWQFRECVSRYEVLSAWSCSGCDAECVTEHHSVLASCAGKKVASRAVILISV